MRSIAIRLFQPQSWDLRRLASIMRNEQLILMLLAVLAGCVGGYSALGFRGVAALLQGLFYGARGEDLIARIHLLPFWELPLLPALGGLIVGLLNRRFLDDRPPQGVAHIIECSMIHGGRVPTGKGLASAVGSAVSIGCGASVGREGAILHLASTLSSWLGQRLHLGQNHAHTVLACGVAAALSASFNAPIAGVFFALEVILRHYALSAFAPVVISSVIGTIITRVRFGDFPAYVLPHYQLGSYWEFPLLLLLGLLSGGAAILFSATSFAIQDRFAALRLPSFLKPALGGLIVGILGLAVPEILGVGYGTTNAALNQELGLSALALLFGFKILATSISFGSGFGGGVFSPSLYVGACLGGACGLVAAGLFPHLGIHPGLYAIAGMAAVSASMLGAPISTILTVFELLGDFQVTIAVMSAAAVSTLLVQQLLGKSFYTWQLERRGVVIEGARAAQLLRERTVAELMTAPYQLIPAETKLGDLKLLLQCLPEGGEAMVVEEGLRFVGTVSRDDLKDVALDPLVDESVQEALYFTRMYPAVLPVRTTLEEGLRVMTLWDHDRLPVVRDEASMEAAGMIDRKSLVDAYNKALLQAEAERGL